METPARRSASSEAASRRWDGVPPEVRRERMASIGRKNTEPKSAEHRQAIARARRKLGEDQVREIKRLLTAGWSASSIARELGVGTSTVADIRHGRSWADVV